MKVYLDTLTLDSRLGAAARSLGFVVLGTN